MRRVAKTERGRAGAGDVGRIAGRRAEGQRQPGRAGDRYHAVELNIEVESRAHAVGLGRGHDQARDARAPGGGQNHRVIRTGGERRDTAIHQRAAGIDRDGNERGGKRVVAQRSVGVVTPRVNPSVRSEGQAVQIAAGDRGDRLAGEHAGGVHRHRQRCIGGGAVAEPAAVGAPAENAPVGGEGEAVVVAGGDARDGLAGERARHGDGHGDLAAPD